MFSPTYYNIKGRKFTLNNALGLMIGIAIGDIGNLIFFYRLNRINTFHIRYRN